MEKARTRCDMTIAVSAPPRPKFFYFINGIKTDAGNNAIWPKRMERLIESLPWTDSLRAYSYTYHAYALTRWMKQAGRVRDVREDLYDRRMLEEDVVLVGHSNGCAIIADLLKNYPEINVSQIHLIAGAVEDSFEKNGLNKAVERKQVGEIFLYCSDQDKALKWARMTHWVNWIDNRWGYGDLGKVGPSDCTDQAKSLSRIRWFEGYDHSDYFSDVMCPSFKMSRFLVTANMIMAPERFFNPQGARPC